MKITFHQRKLSLFFFLLTVITTLNGVFMWLACHFHKTVSTLGFFQMMIPISVTLLVFLATLDKDAPFPKYVCKVIFATDILLILWTVLECFIPSLSQNGSVGIILIIGTLAFYLALFFEPASVRTEYGFSFNNSTKSIRHLFFYSFLFLMLDSAFYFIRVLFDSFCGNHSALPAFADSYRTFLPALPLLMFLFFLSLLPYLGEEYCWRGFLQPLLQKRFGTKKGILLTGLIWGFWHLPMILDAYRFSGDFSSLFMLMTGQICFCTAVGIFLGYAYLKAGNIWICVIIHYFNNTMDSMIELSSSESSMNDLMKIAILMFAALLVFAPFLHAKIFQDSRNIDSFLLPRKRSDASEKNGEDDPGQNHLHP